MIIENDQQIRAMLRALAGICAALADAIKYTKAGDHLTAGDKLQSAERRILRLCEQLGPDEAC